MTLELPYPPSANNYWRVFRNRILVSAQARAYKFKVGLLAKQQRGAAAPLTGPVSVTLMVFRPRRIGDLDNTQKVLLDSIKGIAFVDDSQVVEIHAVRADDKVNPRVVVTIEECK